MERGRGMYPYDVLSTSTNTGQPKVQGKQMPFNLKYTVGIYPPEHLTYRELVHNGVLADVAGWVLLLYSLVKPAFANTCQQHLDGHLVNSRAAVFYII